ncbi:MAG: NnrS family protein [Chloroflexi bacterium]|nr:NnrS family protein [Chloroflexota bacterium]
MESENTTRQAIWKRRIHEPFITAALAVALTAGFGYGAILVASLAFGVMPGSWYSALVQAHGHAQLFGWLGLAVLGMGLFFMPRLRGVSLQSSQRLPYAFALLVSGIVLRVAAQPLAGWFAASAFAGVPRAAMLGAAFLEAAGLVCIAWMLMATARAAKPLKRDAPAYPVEPFARIGFVCLALAFFLNLLGTWNAFTESRNVIAARYDQLAITLMLYGVAIPMAIVFSLRNLPLFLRLALPPRNGWRKLAAFYAFALALRALPFLVAIADDGLVFTGRVLSANYILVLTVDALAVLGVILLNACILIFLWRLDLVRRRPPWTVDRAPDTRPDLEYLRKPTRAHFPDYGEYGRFEWLIYSAFAWLVVAVILDVLRALPGVNESIPIPQDAARHALMAGFITLLICGMSVRMAPGFSGKRGVTHPDLVTWLFGLGNLAAFLRVAPAFFPQSEFALMLWGVSGFIGWCAVLVLALILWRTFR